LQANRAHQGDLTGGYDIPGIGVGIYVGSAGNVAIETLGGDSVVYTAVPQGTFMQVPLFKAITATTTTAADLTVSYLATPYK